MADNITIPATGSGSATPVVATDDAGVAGHVQLVKLAVSTDGSAALIPAEATNGLDVDVTRLPALVAGTANIGDVDVLTVPAPLSTTGGGTEATALRVTLANDSTGLVSIDDNGASLTVDTAANTPLLTRANDGTNTETTLFDLDSGVGSQFARGISLRKIASGGSVEAGTSTDPLRTDPTGTTAQPVTDASGTLTVDAPVGTPVAVRQSDGSAFFKIPTSHANNVAFVDATVVAGQFDDTTPGATTENNVGPVRMSSRRELYIQLRDAAGNERGVNVSAGNAILTDASATTQPVSGTLAVSSITTSVTPGTAAANLGKAEDAAHTTGDVGVMSLGTANEANTVRGADNDYCPLATDTEGNQRVVGNRDHDAVDAGEVVKIGGVAVSGSSTPTSVAAADRTRWIFNQHGVPYTLGGHPNLITREFDFGTAAQTDLNLAEAVVAADERIYVTGFEAMCDNANTVAVAVRAGFGAASVPTASATGVSGMIASHPGIAAGSGIVIGDGSGVIAVGSAGSEPRLTSSAATSGNLHVVIRYFLVDETP